MDSKIIINGNNNTIYIATDAAKQTVKNEKSIDLEQLKKNWVVKSEFEKLKTQVEELKFQMEAIKSNKISFKNLTIKLLSLIKSWIMKILSAVIVSAVSNWLCEYFPVIFNFIQQLIQALCVVF